MKGLSRKISSFPAMDVKALALCSLFFLFACGSDKSVAQNSQGKIKEKPKVLKRCTPCHTFNRGGRKRVGPNLFGIVGAKAGKSPGFKYSESFLAALHGKVWDEERLDAWIRDARAIAKKTRMRVRIPEAKDRTAIIQYMKTLQ